MNGKFAPAPGRTTLTGLLKVIVNVGCPNSITWPLTTLPARVPVRVGDTTVETLTSITVPAVPPIVAALGNVTVAILDGVVITIWFVGVVVPTITTCGGAVVLVTADASIVVIAASLDNVIVFCVGLRVGVMSGFVNSVAVAFANAFPAKSLTVKESTSLLTSSFNNTGTTNGPAAEVSVYATLTVEPKAVIVPCVKARVVGPVSIYSAAPIEIPPSVVTRSSNPNEKEVALIKFNGLVVRSPGGSSSKTILWPETVMSACVIVFVFPARSVATILTGNVRESTSFASSR